MNILARNWGRLSLEAFVIIVSVLVALAVDGWREANAERSLERHLLEMLADDIRSDLEELEASLDDTRFTMQASEFLLGPPAGSGTAGFARENLAPSRFVENSRMADVNSPEQAAIVTLVGGIDFDVSDVTYGEMMSTGDSRGSRS